MSGTREGGMKATSLCGCRWHCSDNGGGDAIIRKSEMEHHSRWKAVDPMKESCPYGGWGAYAEQTLTAEIVRIEFWLAEEWARATSIMIGREY